MTKRRYGFAMVRAMILSCLVVALAACGGGGGGGGGSGIDPRLARLDIYEAQRLRVLGDPAAGVVGLPPTPRTGLPDAGQVTFDGAATIQIAQPAGLWSLAGDAALTLDFAGNSASGSVTAVFGDSSAGGIVDYAGSLALGGAVDDAVFALGYAGTLTAGGDVLVFDGDLVTTVLGDPVAGIAGLDLEAVIDHGGAQRQGSVVIFGEGAVTPPAPQP